MQLQNEKEAATLKQSMNPWQRVCANVEFTAAATTVGGKDISRMKAAMLARKADLTQKQSQAPML
jgi:ABC-type nitrate/sulfonate/bicarbonate transport system ATPase subunit